MSGRRIASRPLKQPRLRQRLGAPAFQTAARNDVSLLRGAAQVLVSIQGMILIGDPYFNEPSVERMRATAEGAATSAEYNFGVRPP